MIQLDPSFDFTKSIFLKISEATECVEMLFERPGFLNKVYTAPKYNSVKIPFVLPNI